MYVKQLENIRCPSPGWDEGVQVLSCGDAIAKVLELEILGIKEKNEHNSNK